MKKLWTALCVLGVLLIIMSLVVTVIYACKVAPNIVGGAGWPTLIVAFEMRGRWLAEIGWVAVVVSAAGLLYKKK